MIVDPNNHSRYFLLRHKITVIVSYMTDIDEKYMRLAILEANKALLKKEVPIGAVLVGFDGQVISRGHNLIETRNDSCAHAEMITIKKASRKLKSWRLTDSTIYITLEPCIMCLGAIINSRISRIVFGTHDSKARLTNIMKLNSLPTKLEIHKANKEIEKQCSNLVKSFFKKLRHC